MKIKTKFLEWQQITKKVTKLYNQDVSKKVNNQGVSTKTAPHSSELSICIFKLKTKTVKIGIGDGFDKIY